MNGCIEAIHRDGVIVAEKHRYDNRLSMAVLTRLDRQTEDSRQDASAARIVADEFEQFLDVLETGADARAFMAARRPADAARVPGREEALLARLENYRKYRVGLAAEIDVSDLQAADMEAWNEEQIERADLSGMLARLGPDQWPHAVREAASGDSHGMSQLHQHFRKLHPPEPMPPQEEFAGSVWDNGGIWWTNFPPPEGFDGEEVGHWNVDSYKRTLTAAEKTVMDADQAVMDTDLGEAWIEELAKAEVARRKCFGFPLNGADDAAREAAEPLPVVDPRPKAQPCP